MSNQSQRKKIKGNRRTVSIAADSHAFSVTLRQRLPRPVPPLSRPLGDGRRSSASEPRVKRSKIVEEPFRFSTRAFNAYCAGSGPPAASRERKMPQRKCEREEGKKNLDLDNSRNFLKKKKRPAPLPGLCPGSGGGGGSIGDLQGDGEGSSAGHGRGESRGWIKESGKEFETETEKTESELKRNETLPRAVQLYITLEIRFLRRRCGRVGLRRQIKALVRKGASSNLVIVTINILFARCSLHRSPNAPSIGDSQIARFGVSQRQQLSLARARRSVGGVEFEAAAAAMGESVTIEVGVRKAPLPLDLFLLRVLFLFAAPAGLSSSCPRSPRRRRAVLWRLPEETGVGKRRRVSGKGDGFFSYFYRLWPLPLPLSLSF